jgi:hypothetical protein
MTAAITETHHQLPPACRWCGGELTQGDEREPADKVWRHKATNRVICKGLMRLAEPRVTEDDDGGN